jgi:hypothetical protein
MFYNARQVLNTRTTRKTTREENNNAWKKKSDDTMKNIALCSVNFFQFHFSPPLKAVQGVVALKIRVPTSPLEPLNELKNRCGGLRAGKKKKPTKKIFATFHAAIARLIYYWWRRHATLQKRDDTCSQPATVPPFPCALIVINFFLFTQDEAALK